MTGPKPSGLTDPKAINHLIPVAEAAAMTARSRNRNPGGVKAWLFDRGAFDALLGQPGCAGIRVYRAAKDDGTEQLVVVGTDEKGNDLLPATADGKGLVAELAWPCPPACGAPSVLGG
jgi:hypothetical protein